LEEPIRREKYLYEQSRERPVFQKYCNGKMKGKKDQRNKGFKLPFSRTNTKKISKVCQPKMRKII
jgi:hypothetical protein